MQLGFKTNSEDTLENDSSFDKLNFEKFLEPDNRQLQYLLTVI